MLYATNNKKFSAIIVYGDYYDLRDVHTAVHYLSDKGGLDIGMSEFLLSFAYDLRKAYEGKREVVERGFDFLDKATYRGVPIYWPYYLAYLRLLRQCAARTNTLRWHQGVLYQLEGLVEQALLDVEGNIPDRILGWIDNSIGFDSDYLPEWIRTCCRYYVEGPRGKKRALRLLTVLQRFSPLSPEYRDFYSSMAKAAENQKCSILSLQDMSPWPDGEEIE